MLFSLNMKTEVVRLTVIGFGVLFSLLLFVTSNFQFMAVDNTDEDSIRNTAMAEHNTDKCKHRLPRALIAGFQKCGTLTLKTFLNIHPDISATMDITEVNFFNMKNYTADYEWYRSLMSCSLSNQITLEKSPHYAVHPAVPKRVYDMDRNMKIIFIVRDPVWRIISRYTKKMFFENVTLDALENFVLLPDGRVNENNEMVRISRYHIHIKNWLKYFNRSQIHVVDGDIFVKNPADELCKVEEFLRIRPYITANNFIYNEERGFMCMKTENRKGDTTSECMKKGKGRKHPEINKSLLMKLYSFYKVENEEFYQLIGRRFNWPSSF